MVGTTQNAGVGIDRKGDEVVLRGGSEKAFPAVAWSIFVLIGLSMVTVGTALADRVTGGLVLIFVGWVFIRLLRVQVRASTDTLVIRGWWRSRTLRWADVIGAEVVAANPASRLFGILRVRDASEGWTKVDGIGNWLRSADPDALPVAIMAAEINKRAAAAR